MDGLSILLFSTDLVEAKAAAQSLGLQSANLVAVDSQEKAVKALEERHFDVLLLYLSGSEPGAPGTWSRWIGRVPSQTRVFWLARGDAEREASVLPIWPASARQNQQGDASPGDQMLFDRLLRAESGRTISNLTRGIAFHLKHSLATVLGNADILLHDSPLDVQSRAMLQEILDQSQQANRLLRRLEELSADAPEQRAEININQLIRNLVEASEPWKDELGRQGRAIKIELDLDRVPPVVGDMTALREAFRQLLVNAIEAIAESGTVRLKTEQAANRVRILFTDDGVGVPHDLQKRMFQPFITSKGPQKVGLGLSVVQSIIVGHGGTVDISSQESVGTTVIVSLPITPPEGVELDAPSQPASRNLSDLLPPRKVLVIEGDASARELLTGVLSEEGQRVTAASSSEEGLSAFLQGRHAMVFMDWGKDGVSALQVAQKIKQVEPNTRVVLVTNWGSQVDAQQAAHWLVDDVLSKPLTRSQFQKWLYARLALKSTSDRAV